MDGVDCSSGIPDAPLLAGGGVGHAVGLNGLDAHLGKVLPVALQLLVLLLPLEVEDQDLFAAAFAENFGGDLGGAGLATVPASPETARTSLNSTVLSSDRRRRSRSSPRRRERPGIACHRYESLRT
jgi:hypothetical protein